MGPRRGEVEIEFATLEDLERIYRVMTEGRAPDGLSRARPEAAAQRRDVDRLLDAPADAGDERVARARARATSSAAAPAGSSRENSSHTTAAIRVSRSSR